MHGKIISSLILFALVLLLVVGAVGYLAKDLVASMVLEQAIHKLTGLRFTVGALQFDLRGGKVALSDVKFYNPPGFSNQVMAEFGELYLHLDWTALLTQKKIHLPEIRLDLERVHLEKNPKGAVNLRAIRTAKREEKPEGEAAKRPAFRVDRLELTARRMEFEDWSGVGPKKLEFDLGIEREVFTGVTDPRAIVQIIILRILYKATLGNLGIDLGALGRDVSETVEGGRELLKAQVQGLRTTVQETRGVVGQLFQEARQVTKAVSSGVAGTLKTVGTQGKGGQDS